MPGDIDGASDLNHLYAYANNNSLRFYDVYGLTPEQCGLDKDDVKKAKKCKTKCSLIRGWFKVACFIGCTIFTAADDAPGQAGRIPRPDHNPAPPTVPRKPNPKKPDPPKK